MKNIIKLLSVSLIVIFGISLCTVPILATNTTDVTVAPSSVTTTPTETPVATEAPVTTEPTAPEPTVTVATEPTTKATQTTTKATRPKPSTKNTRPTQAPTQIIPTTTQATQSTTRVQYYTSATKYTYSNIQQESTTKSTETSTYATDKKRVDEDNLDSDDWDDIKNKLLNNDDDKKGNSDDFVWIHENTKKDDDGLWMLVLGVTLVILGAGTIVFWIVFTIRKKRNDKSGKNGRNRGSAHSDVRRTSYNRAEHPQREVRARRSDDYNDYYQANPYTHPERTSSHERRQINRRSKFDTGEVVLPRRNDSPARRNNGTRYRH